MEIVAIINRKGGVGKTATAQALGAGLKAKGKKVLFIDLDSQANLTYGVGATSKQIDIMEVLTGEEEISDAVQHTKQGDIIAGSEALAAADKTIVDTGKEYRLKEALNEISKDYDYIIIDTPAQLGTLTINALTAAHSVIIPVQAEVFSLQGIGQLNKTIEAVKKYCNKDLFIKGILTTRYNGRAVISKDMQANLKAIAEQLNTKVYKTPIRECTAIKEAQASQMDIFSYAPKCNASLDYLSFVEEFLN